MSPGVTIVLIIVVWLFVLAPILLRGQRPIRRSGEAYDQTRVLFEGDAGEVPVARRPKVSAADIHTHRDADQDLDTLVAEVDADTDDEYELIDDLKQPRQDVVEGEVIVETPEIDASDNDAEDQAADTAEVEEEGESSEENSGPVEAYSIDESFTSPVDLMYPGANDHDVEDANDNKDANEEAGKKAATEVEVKSEDDARDLEELEDESAEHKRAESKGLKEAHDTDLTDEELAFAQRRRGRGGWDPVADKQNSATRYERRQRTLMSLAVVDVVVVALGIIFGSWVWALAAGAGLITVLYLVALRTQVRQEQQLRARRVYQLRRARLGVRNARDEELEIPRKLRRPGAVVVEADDDSVDFHHLPVSYISDDEDSVDASAPILNRRELRDELSERRVS